MPSFFSSELTGSFFRKPQPQPALENSLSHPPDVSGVVKMISAILGTEEYIASCSGWIKFTSPIRIELFLHNN